MISFRARFILHSTGMNCMCVNTTSVVSSLYSGEVRFRREARGERSQISVLTCVCVGSIWGLWALALCQVEQPTQWNPMNAVSPHVDIAISIMHGLYSQNQSLLTCQVQQSGVRAERNDVIQLWKLHCGREVCDCPESLAAPLNFSFTFNK